MFTVFMEYLNIMFGLPRKEDALTRKTKPLNIMVDGEFPCIQNGKKVLKNSLKMLGIGHLKNILLIE